MSNPVRNRGFSFIEVMLVVAILGIVSAIAVPSFMGQRRRARVIGDAISHAKVLQMGLESLKADTGTYGAAGVYQWHAVYNAADTGYALIPTFQPTGGTAGNPSGNNSRMDYTVTIGAGGLTYLLDVNDTSLGGARVYGTNQFGQELFRLQ